MDKLKGKAISCKIAGKYFLPAVIALAFSTGAMQASEKGRTSFDFPFLPLWNLTDQPG